MDQKALKAEYERTHNIADSTREEIRSKLALIVDGAKPSEIVCLKNIRTGELYYTRQARKER